mgnify:FL=1
MEGPRATKPEEVQPVIDLVNLVFRTGNHCKPTMGIEFPLLLCEENRENMRIITENGQPVSDINYYPSSIAVEGSTIRAASVGAVCTHPDYRGRHFATMILDDVEARMHREGVEVMLVSGGRGLYRRRQCVRVGGFDRAVLKPGKSPGRTGLSLVAMERLHLREAVHLYNQEAVRFHRTCREFTRLHEGVMTPWGNRYFKSYLVRIDGKAAAYFVVRFFRDSDRAEIREYAGDRMAVIQGIRRLIQDGNLSECALVCGKNDGIRILLEEEGIPLQHQDQQGTLKILDFPSLMNSLQPYMKQYLPDEAVDALEFTEEDGTFSVCCGEETMTVNGMDDLGQLLFGQREQDSPENVSVRKELAGKPELRRVVDTVFPIPFPWTDNMNFI